MPEFFAILFMMLAAFLGLAFTINFFWQSGFRQAFAYAALFVGIVVIFGASGIWLHASRHSWGALAPLFALMLGAGWLILKYAPRLWLLWKNYQDQKKDK